MFKHVTDFGLNRHIRPGRHILYSAQINDNHRVH